MRAKKKYLFDLATWVQWDNLGKNTFGVVVGVAKCMDDKDRMWFQKFGFADQERNNGWARDRDIGLREVSLRDGTSRLYLNVQDHDPVERGKQKQQER